MDREGNFRGSVLSVALQKADKTASRFVELKMRAEEMWDGESWIPWAEYDQEVYGSVCVIKKDGTINKRPVETLLRNGWSGDFAAIVDGTVQLEPMRFTVKKNEYTKGDGAAAANFKIDWIDEFESTPGGGGLQSNIDANEARSMSAIHGGAIRALAGNLKRNAAAPSGRPAAPPPAGKFNSPEAIAEAQAASAAGGDVPW